MLGEPVVLNGTPCTVIGIAPAGFHGVTMGVRPELWLPAPGMLVSVAVVACSVPAWRAIRIDPATAPRHE